MVATPEQTEHDLYLFINRLMGITGESGAKNLWHNAGVQMGLDILVEGLMTSAAQIGLTHDPVAMQTHIRKNLELVFQIGYELGEGPEHIIKCTCDGVNPEQN